MSIGDIVDAVAGLLLPLVAAGAVVAVVATVWVNRVPRFRLGDFGTDDQPTGNALAKVIQTELYQLRSEGAGSSLRFVTGPDEEIELPEEIAKPSFVAVALQLVRLLPSRVYSLEGTLHPAAGRGTGLTLSLLRGNTLEASTTLWADDYRYPPTTGAPAGEPPADEASGTISKEPATADQYLLALAGAAWFSYQLPTERPYRKHSALPTTNWESYAHFRVGADYQSSAEVELARQSYVRALDHDPHNRGALFNLAVLDIYAGCNGPAIDRLSALSELFDADKSDSDRLWYRVRYNLAVALLHQGIELLDGHVYPECRSSLGETQPGDIDRLLTMAEDAVISLWAAAYRVLPRLRSRNRLLPSGIRAQQGLIAFIETAVLSADILFSDIRQLRDAA